MRYRFGELSFDTETRELRRADETVHLPPKVHRLLEVLLAERPRVVPHEELHQQLWPDIYVSDASLARVVSELRSALAGPDGDSGHVRTAHRVGYAFEGQVEVDPRSGGGPPRLLVRGREHFELQPGINVLGRTAESVVPFDSSEVSRRHCLLEVVGDQAWIEDLGSKNGTWVRGVRVEQRTELAPGDLIELGSERLVYGERGSIASTETSERPSTDPGPSAGRAPGES